MDHGPHRNISFATAAGLRDLLDSGVVIEVRGQRVRELRNRITVLAKPRERCLFLPNRGNDVVATLAETIWVVAGRDDVAWLAAYLPRAPDFSDDGRVWRGAYGPRLRNWNGVDQLAETRRLLLAEAETRRAVMSLYDPARDFVESRDIPCNNWLHWLIRDGKLNLTVGVRSNDVIWGFSGVNSFEWSVLQDMMAFWTGTSVGDATYLATSYHLYARHDDRARRILEGFQGVTCYDFGLEPPRFVTPLDQIDEVLREWFALEAVARADPGRRTDAGTRLGDPFLATALDLMRLYHGANSGWEEERLADELAGLPCCDLAAAAYEYYCRRFPALAERAPDRRLADFLRAYREGAPSPSAEARPAEVMAAIKRLHAKKDAAYGSSWKKRGELTSILANVARKVDRLGHHAATGARLPGESVLDTAVDLFVYLLKYRLYLLEGAPAAVAAAELPGRAPPFSDDLAAFDASADRYAACGAPGRGVEEAIAGIARDFENLHAMAASGTWPPAERLAAASDAAAAAFELVLAVAGREPAALRDFLASA